MPLPLPAGGPSWPQSTPSQGSPKTYLQVGKVTQDLHVVLVDAQSVEVALDGLAILSIRAVQQAAVIAGRGYSTPALSQTCGYRECRTRLCNELAVLAIRAVQQAAVIAGRGYSTPALSQTCGYREFRTRLCHDLAVLAIRAVQQATVIVRIVASYFCAEPSGGVLRQD